MGVSGWRKLVGSWVCMLWAALLNGVVVPGAGAEEVEAPARASATERVAEDALNLAIRKRMDDAGIVGAAAAVIVDRRVVWARGWGYANQAAQTPFTADTVMNVGSITKTITGAAVMQAVQDGQLSLDVDINTYLPFRVRNPFFPDARITLRQLATHTSGLTDRWEVYRDTYHWGADAPEPVGEFLKAYLVPGGSRFAKQNFLPVPPGTHREYSNIGAGLAGFIVERAVGQPLAEFTKRRIFEPLGMSRTYWRLADVPTGAHSTLYVGQSGLSIPIPLYGMTTFADGGLRTSVNDLSRFFIALLNSGQYQQVRILEPQVAEEMLRFQYTEANKPDNVNLKEKNSGIFWSTKFNVTRIGHGGSDPGVRAEMLSDLSRQVAVVLLTNTSIEGAGAKVYSGLLQDLWAHAEAVKRLRAP